MSWGNQPHLRCSRRKYRLQYLPKPQQVLTHHPSLTRLGRLNVPTLRQNWRDWRGGGAQNAVPCRLSFMPTLPDMATSARFLGLR